MNLDESRNAYWVASDLTTSRSVLKKLSGHKNWGIRSRVAGNPNTSPSTLRKLSGDESLVVRCRVARNSQTSADTLAKLSEDEVWDVRYSVASNPNTPSIALERLSRDDDKFVRKLATCNDNNLRTIELIKVHLKSNLPSYNTHKILNIVDLEWLSDWEIDLFDIYRRQVLI